LQLLDLFAYLDGCLETSDNAVNGQNRGYKLADGYVPGLGNVCATAAALTAAGRCGPGLSARLSQLLLQGHKEAGGANGFCCGCGGIAIAIRLLGEVVFGSLIVFRKIE